MSAGWQRFRGHPEAGAQARSPAGLRAGPPRRCPAAASFCPFLSFDGPRATGQAKAVIGVVMETTEFLLFKASLKVGGTTPAWHLRQREVMRFPNEMASAQQGVCLFSNCCILQRCVCNFWDRVVACSALDGQVATGPAMGVLLKGILVAALVAAAAATSVEWRELHAPEHHVHAVKCAKVACMPACSP